MEALSYTIVRTRRKTICLQVLQDATLQVRAPLRTSAKAIEELVAQHASWIRERQQAAAAQNAARSRICLYPGGKTLYRGSWYPVTGGSQCPEVTFDGTAFSLPQTNQEQPGSAMEAWLKGQAKAILTKRCAELAAKMGVCYRQIKVEMCIRDSLPSDKGEQQTFFTFKSAKQTAAAHRSTMESTAPTS